MAMQMKTKKGLKVISEEKLKELLEAGKIKGHMKIITFDEGDSMVSVDDALNPAPDIENEEDEFAVEDDSPPPYNKRDKRRRLFLIITMGILTAGFFLPQSVLPRLGVRFGWDTWYGITTFIFSLFGLAAAILDFILNRIQIIRSITKWSHLGLHGMLTLVDFLGFIFCLTGVGTYGYGGIPIVIIPMLAAAIFGLVISIKIIRTK